MDWVNLFLLLVYIVKEFDFVTVNRYYLYAPCNIRILLEPFVIPSHILKDWKLASANICLLDSLTNIKVPYSYIFVGSVARNRIFGFNIVRCTINLTTAIKQTIDKNFFSIGWSKNAQFNHSHDEIVKNKLDRNKCRNLILNYFN